MLTWKKHAILTPPTAEEIALMEPEKLIELHTLYHKAIKDAESDPYRYGLRLSSWHRADKYLSQRNETVILGGNRSSKTTYAGSVIVRAAMENANSTIWCFAQTNEVSISIQQAAIYAALPAEMRGQDNPTGYTKKNGFPRNSAGKCAVYFPNGSEVNFKAYSQFLNNDTILEGAELGCKEPNWVNIGAWCDEYLVGPELLETLRFRTLDRAAKILVTFTPIDGYTEVVRDYLHNAKTIEWGVAELLDNEKVPLVQESKNRNASIIYFHTKENPYAGYKQMVETLSGRPKEEVLTRAYGVATKSIQGKFPMFSREVNVIKDELIPDLKTCTLYMILDPAGSKNWFMCWIAVDPTETYYIYREWPDQNDGDWAEWRNGEWCPGPGAKGLGYGIRDYVDLIKRYEGKEEIFERLIDPRMGAAKHQTQTGASSMIEELDDAGMVFIPAPGLEIEEGIQALQSKMSYDKTKPMDSLNRPHFYVSEKCENIIKALQEYTGEGGSTEAWKDPIDVIRYAAIDGIRYLDLKNMKAVKPRKGY